MYRCPCLYTALDHLWEKVHACAGNAKLIVLMKLQRRKRGRCLSLSGDGEPSPNETDALLSPKTKRL